MNIIELGQVSKSFGPVKALEKINLTLESGRIIGLLGTNGSGDSDIMMTDTINSFKSKFKGFHKSFKQDDLGLSLSFFY